MLVLFPCRGRNGFFDNIDQFPGGLNRLLGPGLANKRSNSFSPFFLAIFIEDAGQFIGIGFVD